MQYPNLKFLSELTRPSKGRLPSDEKVLENTACSPLKSYRSEPECDRRRSSLDRDDSNTLGYHLSMKTLRW